MVEQITAIAENAINSKINGINMVLVDLKELNNLEKSFKANGKTYFIEAGDISIERWAKYEEFTLELQYGVSQTEMFQNWKKITQLANELKFSDIAVLANKIGFPICLEGFLLYI